ncbi:unnamed protein product [Protopolystoma xenopodis]|uniref:Uncharacterized protein n=1 Tax=Protopolystoma xenopodis TaxID=117903 RepID=A0A448XKC2_9PLAT|nr:unnamed protein product [Protopolystoma xenopodis]
MTNRNIRLVELALQFNWKVLPAYAMTWSRLDSFLPSAQCSCHFHQPLVKLKRPTFGTSNRRERCEESLELVAIRADKKLLLPKLLEAKGLYHLSARKMTADQLLKNDQLSGIRSFGVTEEGLVDRVHPGSKMPVASRNKLAGRNILDADICTRYSRPHYHIAGHVHDQLFGMLLNLLNKI